MSGTARWASRFAIVAGIAFVAGPLLAHLQVVPAIVGFVLYGLGGLCGLIALVLSVIGAVRTGIGTVRSSLGLGAIVTAVFIMTALPGRRVPPINDITTDMVSPPQFVHAGSLAANRGRDMSYPGPAFADQQRAGYPALAPLPLPVSPDDAFKRVESVARQMPTWEVTFADPAAHALEGIDTTYLFRFQDDFVIEARPQNEGSIVQMRSKSRNGKGDVGANAARIEAFFTNLR